MPRIVLVTLLFCVACGGDAARENQPNNRTISKTYNCYDGPGELFEARIAPLLEQSRPSSCSKCHGAGIDLAAFVTGDACGSMACLVEQEMVDLDNPAQSQLLTFIERGFNPAPDSGVTEEMVAAEYDGFLAWIEWTAQCQDACPELASQQCNVSTEPDRDPEPTRPEPPPLNLDNYPCTVEAQAQAFLDWTFPSQGRCGHCHAVNGALAGAGGAATWIGAHQNLNGALFTIQSLYAVGAINLESPPKSRLVLKPLHEDYGGIEHAGGSKFRDTNDTLYIAMVQWLRMQAQCDLYRGTPHPPLPAGSKSRAQFPNLPYTPTPQ